MESGSKNEKSYQKQLFLLFHSFGQKSKELGKSQKSWAKVKRATKKAKSAKITFWAKIERADQKWKELTKSEKSYQKSKICQNNILGKNQKSWPKVKRADQKWKAPQNNANFAFASEKQKQILLKRAKQKAKFGFA